MSKTLNEGVLEVFEAVSDMTFKDVGHHFLSLLLEAEHAGWDGVPAKDKAAVGRFLSDLARWTKYSEPGDAIFTGSRYLTLDGQPEGWKNPTARERAGYAFRATPIK